MRWVLILFWAVWGSVVMADPVRYLLDGSASRVEFIFAAEGLQITGQVPVERAEVMVDFDDLGQSRVDVRLSVARAQTNVPFATEAMKGNSVLAAGTYPAARFQSRKVTRVGDGARLEGMLTLRGVTRPVTLNGAIFRKRGSAADDLSSLVLLFEGAVNRQDFGASGFPALVEDRVALRVLVAIDRAP